MAVTHGHGNPKWSRDEVILALNLYFDCGGNIPAQSDPNVKDLSELLRSFPRHIEAARKESFRNPAGVVFKLQNIRQVATGKGLSNVSRIDVEVWQEFGNDVERTKKLSSLIRAGLEIVKKTPTEELNDQDVFAEGRVVTETHIRRERDPRLRKKLLEQRRASNNLRCDICDLCPISLKLPIYESIFEVHHLLPLSANIERETKLKDTSLLCANCHRMLHRAICHYRRWLTIEEGKIIIVSLEKPNT